MTHEMKLHNSPYEMIQNGSKDIEMRLNDPKRQQIQIGDEIIFTNTKTQERLIAEVIKLHKYPNFHELYDKFPKTRLGYLEDEVAIPEDMEAYYLRTDIEKYGVVGIEIVVKKIFQNPSSIDN